MLGMKQTRCEDWQSNPWTRLSGQQSIAEKDNCYCIFPSKVLDLVGGGDDDTLHQVFEG